MVIVLSFTLVAMSVVPLMLAVNILNSDDMNQRHNWYFVILCLGSSVWSFGYACMGVSDNQDVAVFIRAIIVAAVLVTLSVSIMLIMVWMGITRKFRRFLTRYLIFTGLIVYPFIINKYQVVFEYTPYGYYYRFVSLSERIVSNIYIAGLVLIVLGLILYGFWSKNGRRKKIMARTLLICLGLMLFGLIFDNILPMFGYPLFPACTFAQFISVLIVFRISIKYNVSRITIRNVSEYIYSVVNTPIIILGEEGRVQLANASACDFFLLPSDQIMNKKLNDLFMVDKASKQKQEKSDKASNPAILAAKCLINGAICDLSISEIYDRYQEKLGEVIVISDITDKMDMIQALNESRQEAIQANEAKSAFLANMSHEIRTPMNAIIGMSEIALNHDLPEDIRSELNSIRNAGTGLLSIINDILDFSKIESGHFEIIEAEYHLEDLVTEVVNLLAIRLMNKNIHFLVNVDPTIPYTLIGDDIRIKQILMNIVGNSVKFTNRGFIQLRISSIYGEQNRITLQIEVADTGIGIPKEEMDKLFDKFSQVDSRKNRKIAGTGLGLAISKNLVELMGGTIEVESIYEAGTVFTITLQQSFVSGTMKLPLIPKKNRKVILYESNEHLMDSFTETFLRLGVPFVVCTSSGELDKIQEFTHFFIRKKAYDKMQEYIDRYVEKEKLVLIVTIGEEDDKENTTIKKVFLPLFCFQTAALFNNENISNMEQDKRKVPIKVKALPYAKILIVDDNETNLQVAKGLMAPYKMNIDTAVSGFDALVLIKDKKYDLIFMDHMMPEMDGVDTTRRIRQMEGIYFKTVPIVALTANSITGARENFLKQGFNDFLAKPIEGKELERILKEFLPEKNGGNGEREVKDPEKREVLASIVKEEIEGIHMQEKVATLGGNLAVYQNILRTYYDDMKTRKDAIQRMFDQDDACNFEICVHAMKSASYGVGAEKLGKMAEMLEHACKSRDYSWLNANFSDFIVEVERIIHAVGEYINRTDGMTGKLDKKYVESIPRKILQQMKQACIDMDYPLVEQILNYCKKYQYGIQDEKRLDELLVAYNNFEYETMVKLLQDI